MLDERAIEVPSSSFTSACQRNTCGQDSSCEDGVTNHSLMQRLSAQPCRLVKSVRLETPPGKPIHFLELGTVSGNTVQTGPPASQDEKENLHIGSIRRVGNADSGSIQYHGKTLDEKLMGALQAFRDSSPQKTRPVIPSDLFEGPAGFQHQSSTATDMSTDAVLHDPAVAAVGNHRRDVYPVAKGESADALWRQDGHEQDEAFRQKAQAFRQMLRKLNKGSSKSSTEGRRRSSDAISTAQGQPIRKLNANRRGLESTSSDSGYSSNPPKRDLEAGKAEQTAGVEFNPKAREFYLPEGGYSPHMYHVGPDYTFPSSHELRTEQAVPSPDFYPPTPLHGMYPLANLSIGGMMGREWLSPAQSLTASLAVARQQLASLQMQLDDYSATCTIRQPLPAAVNALYATPFHAQVEMDQHPSFPAAPANQAVAERHAQRPQPVTKPKIPHTTSQQAYEEWIEWRKATEPGYAMECKRRQLRRAARKRRNNDSGVTMSGSEQSAQGSSECF